MSKYTAPEWPSSALITIDTQCDTLDGQPFEISETSAILPRMAELLQAFRNANRPIVHIVRIYNPNGSNVDLCRKEMIEQGATLVLAGTPGSQLAPGILPDVGVELDVDLLLSGGVQPIGLNEVVMYKSRWGAFFNTPLESHLRANGVSTLIFSGCNFPNCPRTSIYEASERDFRIVLVDDAVSGLYDQGKREMHNIGVELISTNNAIESIGKNIKLA